ncbi:MAG: pseudouridine synthase [bacterium]
MRLNQYLAKCGIASRRGADQLIISGRVKVNGMVVRDLGTKLEVNLDRVEVDGRSITPAEKRIYILLNKPAGYISTVKDGFRRPIVMDLVPTIAGIAPVGRLDLNTEGALLLTNDGELAYRLTHPRYQIEKRYLVNVDKVLNPAVKQALINGVDIGDERPASAYDVDMVGSNCLRLSVHEGRKRQIRRMLKSLGYDVTSLRREQFAFLRSDDLEPGTWRYLSAGEVDQLQTAVGIKQK